MERIAVAALEILREKGSSGLTMRGVAARCGLSLSNVQYHFRTRQLLLVGITEHHLSQCRQVMAEALDRADVSLRDVLEVSLMDPSVRQIARPFRELFALALVEPQVDERLQAYYAGSHQQLTALLGQLCSEGGEEPPERALAEVATVLMTAVEGAYLIDEATGVAPDRLVDRLEAAAHLLLGLAPPTVAL